MSDTSKDSEFKAQQQQGAKLPDFKAVIRPKRAGKLVVKSLDTTFEQADPIHTNDVAFIKKCQGNGNLVVALNGPLDPPAKAPAEPAKAKA